MVEEGVDDGGVELPEGPTLVIRLGGGRSGEQYMVNREVMTIGRAPQSDVFLDDITVSRDHARLERTANGVSHHRPRQPQRHLREPAADRVGAARRRRRAADRQVPAELLRAGVTVSADPTSDNRQTKLTIGAVCKMLSEEFGDISISKIRFLEDQRLITPRRTAGRLPAVQRGGRRPAAHDPAHAARRVPAAAGDPPGDDAGSQGHPPSAAGECRRPPDARRGADRDRRRHPVRARSCTSTACSRRATGMRPSRTPVPTPRS